MKLITNLIYLVIYVVTFQISCNSNCQELKQDTHLTKDESSNMTGSLYDQQSEVIPIIFGISGPNLTMDEKKLFTKYPVKGFILYKRNIESLSQVKKLIKDLRNLYDYPILIVTDQEGGNITNIGPKLSKYNFPSQEKLGKNYFDDYHSTIKKIRTNYQIMSNLLNDIGFNSGLSPVCDLKHIHTTSYIGNRSFGANVEQVIDLSKEAIQVMLENSIIPVLKHAPGHGCTDLDSHRSLPLINQDIHFLEENDFKIFKSLIEEFKDSNLFLMTSHVVYKALDPQLPVTISHKAISYIRHELGFQNIILSDAIDMFAVHNSNLIKSLEKKIHELATKYYLIDANSNTNINYFSLLFNKKIASEIESFEEKKLFNKSLLTVTKRALNAGCDIVLHCSGKIKEMKYILENFNAQSN